MRLPKLNLRRQSTQIARAEPQAVVFPGYGGGSYGDLFDIAGSGSLPASDRDWSQDVRDPTLNATVFGCLRWLADNAPEPKLQVKQSTQDGFTPVPTHPLLELLRRPNNNYDGNSLVVATLWDYAISGRGFWIKERDNFNRVKGLSWVPWWTMSPRYPADGSAFITDYLYRPSGMGKGIPYKKEDVVHFRWGLDAATGGRLGVNRTLPVLPAIAALNEGAVYTPSILRNMGVVPNIAFIRGSISPEKRTQFQKWMKSLFTKDNRGSTGIIEMDGPGGAGGGLADLKQLGLSPQDLALDTILDRPDVDVCNAFGIHPGVLYRSGAGGKGFDNGGQQKEARRASYHDALMPMLKRFADTYNWSLLPDFTDEPLSALYCEYDFSKVEALQEDQKELYARNNGGVNAGWLRVSEAREKAGLTVDESDRVYLRKQGFIAVREADANPQPQQSNGGVSLPEDEEPDDEDEQPDGKPRSDE